MGVYHLTTLIKNHVPDRYKDVNLINECQNYKMKFNCKPLIVIDLLGILRLIKNIDLVTRKKDDKLPKLETLCGDRYPKYQKNCEFLFELLSSHGNLVFIADGAVVNDKLDFWMKDKDEEYQKSVKIMESIFGGEKLTDILNKIKHFPGSTFHLKIVEATAKKYGKLIKTATRECDSEIAKHANENNAFAVLAEDSDFLIFKGDWRYFSLNDMDISTLTSKEYNKKALWKFLGLNSFYQMAILATIGGNNLVDYDQVKRCHYRLVKKFNPHGKYIEWNVVKRFQAIADFVRHENDKRKAWEVIEIVANAIDWNKKEKLRPMIKKSLEMYHTNFELAQPPAGLEGIDCCRNFIKNIISGKVTKFSIYLYDLRRNNPKLHDAELKIYLKQVVLVLKDNRKEEIEIISKTDHEIPFTEIISSEKNPQHEELRWKLLKFIINEDKNIKEIPLNFLTDVLVLSFLRREGFIQVINADLIMLTIKMVQDENYETSLDEIPEKLDEKAFRVAFLFSKFYQLITRSLKLSGLKKMSKLIDFDGVIFHNLYLKYSKTSVVDLLGHDLMPYRVYA